MVIGRFYFFIGRTDEPIAFLGRSVGFAVPLDFFAFMSCRFHFDLLGAFYQLVSLKDPSWSYQQFA